MLAMMGLVAITAGTLYQKKFCVDFDLRATVAIQNVVSCVLMLALACLFETMEVLGRDMVLRRVAKASERVNAAGGSLV